MRKGLVMKLKRNAFGRFIKRDVPLTCNVEWCNKKHHAKGYCRKHYENFKHNGYPVALPRARQEKCTIEGCKNKYCAKGYCWKHYWKNKIYGNPLAKKELAKEGRTVSNGYIVVKCIGHPAAHRNYVYEHRLVMEKSLGRHLTKIEVVHHIDGNKKNNNINNLKLFKDTKTHLSFHRKIKRSLHAIFTY